MRSHDLGANAAHPIAAAGWCASARDRVVAPMGRYGHVGTCLTGQDVVATVIFFVEYMRSHERTNHAVIVNLAKTSAIFVMLIVHIDNIEAGTALVLFAGLIHVTFHGDSVMLELVIRIHFVKSCFLTLEALLAQVVNFGLLLLQCSSASLLVGLDEVLREALLLVDEVSRHGVRSKYLSRVHVLIEAARALLQTVTLEHLTILSDVHAA